MSGPVRHLRVTTRARSPWLVALALLFSLNASAPVHAEVAERELVRIGADGKANVDAKNVPLGDVLRALATEARWDIALSVPEHLLRTPVTLRVENRSLDEVVARLNDISGLRIEVGGGFLSATVAPGGSDRSREERREERRSKRKDRGEKKKKKLDRVVFGEPVTVGEHETVGDAVAIGSSLRVDGHVRGDAVALGGPLVLGPTAVVEGDAVAAGGAIEVHPGAQLKGSQVSLPNAVGGAGRWLSQVNNTSQTWANSTFWNVMFTLIRSVGLLVLGLLLLTFIPQRVVTITHTMNARPWMSLVVGSSLVAGLIPLCILLLITLIGIPLIPVAVAIVLSLLWLGATAVASRVGAGLPGHERRGLMLNFTLGVLLVGLCDLIPWAGAFVVFVLSCIGAGAAVLSRLGTRAEPPTVPPPAPPSDPTLASVALV